MSIEIVTNSSRELHCGIAYGREGDFEIILISKLLPAAGSILAVLSSLLGTTGKPT